MMGNEEFLGEFPEVAPRPFKPVPLELILKYISLGIQHPRGGYDHIIRLLKALPEEGHSFFICKMLEHIHKQDQVIPGFQSGEDLRCIAGINMVVYDPVVRRNILPESLNAVDPAFPVLIEIPPLPELEVFTAEEPVFPETWTDIKDT